MDKVATMRRSDRADLFAATAERVGFHPVNVEKDFWVCWILKQLFTIPELQGWLTFKGGTSLSKCFNLIRRFSEDIDLAVDFERLGFTGDRDPRRSDLSHTKRQPLLGEMLGACRAYIAGPFLTAIHARAMEVLGDHGWELRINRDDPNTVEFEYPSVLDERIDYIRPHIVLELGTHADPIPHADFPVRPFAAEQFPGVFEDPTCSITTMVAHRSFWEKATILHAEYHRPHVKSLLSRYSRHYADVAVMARSSVKVVALADLDLLHRVCVHKDIFYHCGWARYLEARPGSFRLLPRDERVSELRRDYQAMRVMFFDDPPEFDDLMNDLSVLEREINELPSSRSDRSR
jgi:hypothetical protein